MTFETISFDLDADSGVATVTLNRPDRYNAFTEQMCDEFRTVWQSMRTDDAVRAVVLTAAGDKAFCTGIDRDEIPDEDAYDFSPHTYEDPGARLGPKANDFWKPVVAAVDGMACGGAFYLLGECDIIIASDRATFFDPHVTYGMPAVFEPALMLARMPIGEVLRMSLLGNHERMSAARAHQIGLVSEITTPDDLPARARWVAQAIASARPAAVQATLRTIWAANDLTRQQMIELGNSFLNLAMTSDSLTDGQAAFASGARIEPHIR